MENKKIQIQEKRPNQVAVKLPVSESTQNLINGLSSANMGVCLMTIRKKASYIFKGGQLDFSVLLSSDTTQISRVNREYGEEVLCTIIFRLLDDMNANFNVSRGMTEAQVYQLAIDISQELWDHRLEEILGFCHAMKRGYFMKIYERIDASIFWEAWEKYQDERSDHLHREHLNLKGSTFKPDRGETPADKLGGIIGGLSALRDRADKRK